MTVTVEQRVQMFEQLLREASKLTGFTVKAAIFSEQHGELIQMRPQLQYVEVPNWTSPGVLETPPPPAEQGAPEEPEPPHIEQGAPEEPPPEQPPEQPEDEPP